MHNGNRAEHKRNSSAGLAMLGGSFNPIHLGHLRLALEIRDQLDLDVELIPSARPPHKSARHMLDFDLRCRLIEPLIASIPRLSLNRLEGLIDGPSYTYETVNRYLNGHAPEKLYFAMGAGDFMTLPDWHRAPELLARVNMIIVPRHGVELAALSKFINDAMHDALRPEKPFLPAVKACWRHKNNITACHYLPVTRMDISSSQVRQAWLRGHSLQGLVPEMVERAIADNAATINEIWRDII